MLIQNTGMKNKNRSASYFPLPGLIALGFGLFFWVLFYPGNLSVDSLYQYSQAITGIYTDTAPPIMSTVVTLIMKIGGDIQTVMLLQVVAGVYGFRALVINILEVFEVSRKTADYLFVIILALFLSPISPLAFYLMTFWKDSWFAILMMWVVAFLIKVFQDTKIPHKKFLAFSIGATTVFSFALLTRHNAIVVLPFFIFSLWIIHKKARKSIYLFIITALLSVLISQGINAFLYSLLSVSQTYPSQSVMVMDLVGILVLKPELHEEFPYISNHLASDYQERYVFGQNYPFNNLSGVAPRYYQDVLGQDPPSDDSESALLDIVILGEKNRDLTNEYFHAISRYPLPWAQVKLMAFYELIRPDKPHTPIYFSGVETNALGLSHIQELKYLRNDYKSLAKLGIKETPLRWISGISIVWIVIGLLEWFLLGVLWLRKRQIDFLFWFSILTIPLSYSGSYLLATIDIDFRFLYPTMLLIQICTISFFLGLFFNRIKTLFIQKL